MTVSDDILIRNCCDGDEHAWETLLRRYAPLVRAVPRRYNLAPDVCDDICQDVFQALVENLPTLRESGALSAWLATITRRRCIRHFEQAAAPTHLPGDAAADATPNAALQQWEDRRALIDAMQQIPAPCRELLHAFFLDPTSPDYAEIARRLGRPIGSLGPMRRRCLARLARLLTPEDAQLPSDPH